MATTSTSPNSPQVLLNLQAVGEPRIELCGSDLTLPTRHAAQALFRLAFADGAELSVTTLGEELWPDAASSQIPPRFATMVWQLRRGLGDYESLLERTRRIIRLDTSAVSLDVLILRSEAQVAIDQNKSDAALATRLRQRILSPWDDYPWVRDEQEHNNQLAQQLG